MRHQDAKSGRQAAIVKRRLQSSDYHINYEDDDNDDAKYLMVKTGIEPAQLSWKISAYKAGRQSRYQVQGGWNISSGIREAILTQIKDFFVKSLH